MYFTLTLSSKGLTLKANNSFSSLPIVSINIIYFDIWSFTYLSLLQSNLIVSNLVGLSTMVRTNKYAGIVLYNLIKLELVFVKHYAPNCLTLTLFDSNTA